MELREKIDENYRRVYSEEILGNRRYVKIATFGPLGLAWCDFAFEDVNPEKFELLNKKIRSL